DELAADLRLIRDSLETNGAHRLAVQVVDPLLRQIGTFGFNLHTLDIRQHARVHQQAIQELNAASGGDEAEAPEVSPETREVLGSLRGVADLKQRYPAQAIRHYVISGSQSERDVLDLVRLARIAGVPIEANRKDGDPGLMPVPLFESIEDLRQCHLV